MRLSIYHYFKRIWKSHMPDITILKYRIKAVKILNIIISFLNIRIYGEIAYPERGKVLKEMSTLAGVDPVVFQTRLDNYPCSGDLWPFNRYTQPWIR